MFDDVMEKSFLACLLITAILCVIAMAGELFYTVKGCW